MTVNKLKKEILDDKATVDLLKKIAGPYSTDVIRLFKEGDEYTPDSISKKTNKKITYVRSVLNSLHYRGIACYKKNKVKKMFYEFKWSIKYKKIIEVVLEQQLEKYKMLEDSISDKKDRDYFRCPKKCVEIPFEIAAAYNFKCPNCNSILELIDIKKVIASIKRKKSILKKNIDRLNEILHKIEDKTKGYICE